MSAARGKNRLTAIARAVADAGGRAYLVGGTVRDHLLGIESKDADVEIHALPPERVEEVLGGFGTVLTVGRAFGVYRVKGIDADFSLPRQDSKRGPGHRGFEIRVDPDLDLAEASRRRDLTINSMARDLLSGELIDPHGGQQDLRSGVLRATDPGRFAEDPLRGLRVAQFSARLEMEPDAELRALCAGLDLSELPAERLLEEFRKLLLKGSRPSRGLEFLRQTDLLRFFPELAALVGVPQDPVWHPEGDVWVHTLMVLDAAAALRCGDDSDEALMFAALCHDLGKPRTTERIDGRWRSLGHTEQGAIVAEQFLLRLRASNELVERVAALVRAHLVPTLFINEGAGVKAYRRLSRVLSRAGVNMALLERLARADFLGRTTPEALAGGYPQGDRFLEKAESLRVHEEAPADIVHGRHLIDRGYRPGPMFGPLLEQCREVQDETGWDDPDRILDRVLEK